MREKYDPQGYFSWLPESSSKTVQEYENKYNRISELLDENDEILDIVDGKLKGLCRPGQKGRKSTYTTEILFRALIVHQLESQPLRGTEILLAHNVFLQDFIRLGNRKAPSYGPLFPQIRISISTNFRSI